METERIIRSRDELTEAEIDALPETHPWKYPDRFSMGGFEFTRATGLEAEVYEQKRREAEKKARADKLYAHYTSPESGVPKKYWKESVDTYVAETDADRRNLERVKAFARESGKHVLAMCGNCGTGKTMLGCAVIRERGGKYFPMLKLVYDIESCIGYSSKKTKSELLRSVCEENMLVLDEVGRGYRKELQAELLYYILNERYGQELPTVLISNFGKKELVEFLGIAVKDRLNETCEFLEFNGKSYRGIKRIESGIDF